MSFKPQFQFVERSDTNRFVPESVLDLGRNTRHLLPRLKITKKPSAYKPRVLKAVDFKSTIIGDLVIFLAYRYNPFYPLSSVIVPELTASTLVPNADHRISCAVAETPEEYPRAYSFQSLHDLAHVLIRPCTWSRAALAEIISSSCSTAICLHVADTNRHIPGQHGFRYFGNQTT
ncbi:MAG: hypothetical protein L0Y67_06450 [Gammaproteobacteria bacterium]|nr:hypothetical protein [Gammaproteobacteria bacterium]